MSQSMSHPGEAQSNLLRDEIARIEPHALRTFTPTQAVIAQSAGVYHWTPEGRRLYDFTSGVLVANLGHNPTNWLRRLQRHLGWTDSLTKSGEYCTCLPLTAYNAITPVEAAATRKLIEFVHCRRGGKRLTQVMWAASGSEAIQKALWAALARDKTRDMIIATRFGFHGKKGLSGAVTGSETDHDRDPRVRFISFPMEECQDLSQRGQAIDLERYRRELDELHVQLGRRLSVLITEPYLGGGGSFHPPRSYLTLLQEFCRSNDIVFILDEVQSNFGRTGEWFAFETYDLEPDMVVLGKGLGNGVPVAAVVGDERLFANLDYGEGSDTWSANPLSSAAVLATLEELTSRELLIPCRRASAVIESELVRLKDLPFVANVRGEKGGMVWGVEMRAHAGRSAADWANAFVLACYRGQPAGEGEGVHLLGPLAKKVVRIAPPLVITEQEAHDGMTLMRQLTAALAEPALESGRQPVLA